MCGGCPCCLYLSISGGLACVEALGSFLVSTFCRFRSYDTPLVSTFCRFLTYENGRRGGRLQTSTGRRTFRAFVLWCGCSFQYTAKPPHVGAFLSCVVHIVHVVHIGAGRVWYSLNAAGRPLPENGQKTAKNSRNIAEKGGKCRFSAVLSVVFLHFTNTAKTRPNEKARRSSVSGFCPVVDTTHTTGRRRTHSGGRVCVRLSTLSIFVHIVPGVEALAVFCSVVDMDTQRGKYRHRPRRSCIRRRVAPLFGCSLFVGASALFCQNNSPALCSTKRRALAPLRVSFVCVFVCVVPIRGGLPGAACISNTSGESKRRMPRALLDVVRILSTLSIS